MNFEIKNIEKQVITGIRSQMNFANHQPQKLWQQLMPVVSRHFPERPVLYSVEVYPHPDFFEAFNPLAPFEKWAAMAETPDFSPPESWEKLELPSGKYAVFLFRGTQDGAADFYQKILTQWLPEAGLLLDHRPHFARMDDRYRNGSPDSEEEIWIPIQ